MGIAEETADWAQAVPVVLFFSCGMGLDWDFAVSSEDISLGSFCSILSFFVGTTLYLFEAFVVLEPRVVMCSYLVHCKDFDLLP